MNLQRLFQPRAVAVVGASRDHRKLGAVIFANLRQFGYAGRVIPVNPVMKRLGGERSYPTVSDIPGQVDCAVIVTPALTVPGILVDCGRKGVAAAVVISAGFRETGKAGAALEDEARVAAQAGGVRLLGPNSLGFINPHRKLNASFAAGLPRPGNVALISQSGAMAVAMTDWAYEKKLDLSLMISLGNKAGLTELDCLEYLASDPHTEVIMMYLESISGGRRFVETARRLARRKPIVALKAGRTAAGQQAAISHTGALTGSDAVTEAVLRQAGVLRATSIEELFDLASALSTNTRVRSRRTMIVTNAGGPGILAADAAAELSLATLAPAAQHRLKKHLPSAASVGNPIDLIGDATPQRYAAALREITRDPQIDNVITIVTPQHVTEVEAIAQIIIAARRRAPQKVWLASFVGGLKARAGRFVLNAAGLANVSFPERAVAVIQRLAGYARPAGPAFAPLRRLRHRRLPSGILNVLGTSAERVLKDFHLPIVRSRLVKTINDAQRLAGRQPVVIKVVSRRFTHKTEQQAVMLDVDSPADWRLAASRLRRLLPSRPAADEGLLIQPMVPATLELLIGFQQDQVFGPVVTVGIGGIHAEQIKDTVSRLAPFSRQQAQRMLSELKLQQLLDAARGRPAVNRTALADFLVRVGQLAANYPEITECDMNPVFVTPPADLHIADARFIVKQL